MAKVQVRAIKIGGNSATNLGDGRGRNGWFTIREVEVAVHPDGSFCIDVWSRQRGDMPPITFSLPDECRRALAQALGDEKPCTT